MSHYSGFSSASRLEIERLNQVNAQLAAENAAEMAAQKALLVAQEARLASMQAMLVSNGLLQFEREQEPIQGTSAQALAQDRAKASVLVHPPQVRQPQALSCSQPAMVSEENGTTPSRKRHSSQQLERAAKVAGFGREVNTGANQNKYEVLKHARSYHDRSMKPPSVLSTPGVTRQRPGRSFAGKVGNAHALQVNGPSQTGVQADSSLILEVDGVYSINNAGALREELEIECNTINGEKFHGTVTHNEAKYIIFKECLGFGNFTNFDGARIAYKGATVVTFKLKTAVNVDQLYHIQHFDFIRKSTIQGRSHTDTIGCKIRGLRRPVHTPSATSGPANVGRNLDDGIRKILIQGCEYRIPRDILITYLSNFGDVTEELTEELFDDGGLPDNELDGTNRTGNYIARIKLRRDIPEWVPILGKRIKISYQGVRRLCTNCFGQHPKKSCQSKKVTWGEYVAVFKNRYQDISQEVVDRTKKQVPMTSFSDSHPAEGRSDLTMDVEADEVVQNYTKDWVNHIDVESNKEMSSLESATNHTDTESTKSRSVPNKADFLVPSNAEEHKAMSSRLIKAGTLPAEAEQIIAMRKSAYNKACREFKKSSNKYEPKKDIAKMAKRSPKNPPKTRKNVASLITDDVN
jgi:hypothetical protein